MLSLKAWGWIPRWLPVRKQFAAGSITQLMLQPDQVEQLPGHHRDLRRVDAVGAEHRAAPALGALVEVVVPLLEDVLRQLARPRPACRAIFPAAVKSLR